MMSRPDRATPDDMQGVALSAAVRRADLTLEQLWTRYFALGGDADLMDVDAHLAGLVRLPPDESDVLAHAVNERLDEVIARHRVPYNRQVRQSHATTGPLAALVKLLVSAGAAPPERLPSIAAEAGRVLGLDLSVHLIDHEQQALVHLPADGQGTDPPHGLDGTLAGRAFRTLRILSSDREERPRLYVPLIDGADRLGVLEARLGEPADLHDPGLREQLTWISSMLGHLIASMGGYGDELERPRRNRPLTPAAELIWQQLPPLTAATDCFVLAGMLEPSYDVGGDAFDYSLSERTVSLALFDAMGHGISAALMAAATLAAYRSTRRDARGVYEQARAIDDVISGTFPGSAFVTGILAELDLATGRLRYVNAGHPSPLLLRDGKVIKELTGGNRVPFGLDTVGMTIAEEKLEPGDWLALYSDGVVEARNAAGRWFGEELLRDFLTREMAASQPPAETVRRLTQTVLRHQGGLLQDDATILLATWRREHTGEG
jgi:serine phosphatase RsbU (regulator of sigma subunit)